MTFVAIIFIEGKARRSLFKQEVSILSVLSNGNVFSRVAEVVYLEGYEPVQEEPLKIVMMTEDVGSHHRPR